MRKLGIVVATLVSMAAFTSAGHAYATTATTSGDAHQPASATDSSTGTFGLLNGEVIDLSKDRRGAKVCMEEIGNPYRCFDDMNEYRAAVGLPARDVGILDKSDCAGGWFCVWDNAYYKNFLSMHRYEGTHELIPRDSANSVWNRSGLPAQLIDVRTLQPDDTKTMGPGYEYEDLGALNDKFNDRADEVKLCDPTGC